MMRCDYCGRDMAEVNGGGGNVTHDGRPWCGCVVPGEYVRVAMDDDDLNRVVPATAWANMKGNPE